MRILVILPEGFGGNCGIALYNRDILTALCAHPDCTEIVAIPRIMPNVLEEIPEKLTYVVEGINSKLRYISTVFKTTKKNTRFDLIICGHINLLPVAYLLHLWLKVPIVLEIYGIEAWKPRSWFSNYLVNKIDTFISISDLTKNSFLEWAKLEPQQGFVLPNVIHTELYGIGAKKTALVQRYNLEDKTVLMTLGRMSTSERYKGFDEILEVLPTLAKQISNVVYLAVGSGNDQQRLGEKAKTLGIAKRVIFTGYVDEKEKADHYRLADVYVMPSRGEGFGFVVLEAMACGIPVVASTSDGTKEAVRNGKLGLLTDPTKPDEIIACILEALNYPKKVPEGIEYFSFQNFSRSLYDIIAQVRKTWIER